MIPANEPNTNTIRDATPIDIRGGLRPFLCHNTCRFELNARGAIRMMRNLEAKFRLADPSAARQRAQAIGFVLRSTFAQNDTFFAVKNGKLKLREEPGGTTLIHYRREASGGLGFSEYTIATIPDPVATRSILESALGVLACVRKRRTLMLRENIRLHLDYVEQLGDFGEIEAVLAPGDSADTYRAKVNEILFRIGVVNGDLVKASYFELIRQSIER